MSVKAKIVTDQEGRFYGIRYNCPGCALHREDEGWGSLAGAHVLPVKWTPPGYERSAHIAGKPQWDFDGNLEEPTFGPSVLSRQTGATVDGIKEPDFVCHSFVKNGRAQFLDDCTHALKGKTVNLPVLNDGDA